MEGDWLDINAIIPCQQPWCLPQCDVCLQEVFKCYIMFTVCCQEITLSKAWASIQTSSLLLLWLWLIVLNMRATIELGYWIWCETSFKIADRTEEKLSNYCKYSSIYFISLHCCWWLDISFVWYSVVIYVYLGILLSHLPALI